MLISFLTNKNEILQNITKTEHTYLLKVLGKLCENLFFQNCSSDFYFILQRRFLYIVLCTVLPIFDFKLVHTDYEVYAKF